MDEAKSSKLESFNNGGCELERGGKQRLEGCSQTCRKSGAQETCEVR